MKLKDGSIKKSIRLDIVVICLIQLAAALPAAASMGDILHYPETRVSDHVDEIFGTLVADPYRWLEEVDSEETLEWISAQNELTFSYLESIPVRDQIRDRLTDLWNYEYFGVPWKIGDRIFYYYNEGLQEFAVLHYKDGEDDDPVVLIDPNGFEGDGNISLSGTSVSNNGDYIAWSTSESGSDWITWHVREIETGEDLDDVILWSKMSGASWNEDDTGFYYSRYAEPAQGDEFVGENSHHMVYYHEIGTSQEQDVLIYQRPDKPYWMLYAWVTEDGRYLLIHVNDAETLDNNGLFYIDLRSGSGEVVELLNDFDSYYGFLGNIGCTFYFTTDLDAPRNRIISVDLNSPSRENWRVIVPEDTGVLRSASLLSDSLLVLTYMEHAISNVKIFDIQGEFHRDISLPCPGSVWGFGGFQSDTETYYTFTSFLHPGEIYRYDFETFESTLYWRPELDADLSPYTTEQVFYESYDGTVIPMFIVYRSDIELDGSNPTLLYGYGGFSASMTPYFSSSRVVWLEMGGVYALPCIRGGGEYGEEWHLAGIKENRHNVFDDFICAAEYLIEEGFTSSSRLAISGGSNGGTLVAACLNRRPDLFGAAIPAMGVMDLLRFHLFTIGWAWTSEYGDPEDEEEFEIVYSYSPYHNIVDGAEYPSVLVTTADHDDRVVPGHSFKYAARLQWASAGNSPILIRIQTDAGHGGSVGLSDALTVITDEYAFLWQELHIDEF